MKHPKLFPAIAALLFAAVALSVSGCGQAGCKDDHGCKSFEICLEGGECAERCPSAGCPNGTICQPGTKVAGTGCEGVACNAYLVDVCR